MGFDQLSVCIRHLTKIAAMDEDELGRLKKLQEELEAKSFKGEATEADHALYKANLARIEELTPKLLSEDSGWKNWQAPQKKLPSIETPLQKAIRKAGVPRSPLYESVERFAFRRPVAAAAGLGAAFGATIGGLKGSSLTPKKQRALDKYTEESGGPLSRFHRDHPGLYGAAAGGLGGAAMFGAYKATGRPSSAILAGMGSGAGLRLADRGMRALEDIKELKSSKHSWPESSPAVSKPKSGPAVSHPVQG